MAKIEDFSDQYWRISNLYYIKNKNGKKVLFKPNWAQKALFDGMWYLNIILKARQLGITTFVQIFMLDRCLFNSNINAGVIAHNRDDAKKFFKDKIKFAYDNLPDVLKQHIKATSDSAGELAFSNGSSIRVGTSLRSGSYQYLHISEFGPLCSKFPERASEVVSGSLNTVIQGQFVFIESTASGAHGHFFDMCKDAEEMQNTAAKLTKMDYKFWFFPWYEYQGYRLDETVEIPAKLESYFTKLEKYDIHLDDKQKAWYCKKEREQKTKMAQEYPSTSTEAFEQVSEYAVYGKEVGQVIEEQRLLDLPVNPSKPVDVFFDIGKSTKSPTTAVWFLQDNDPWFDWIDYYQNSLKTVGGYVNDIYSKAKEGKYRIDRWFIPHDGEDQQDYDIKTFKSRLIDSGIQEEKIVIVKRVSDIKIGIDQMREKFPRCRFDKEKTKKGWLALCSYRYEWDEKRSTMGQPIHNWASHPSDSIRQFAQGYTPLNKNKRNLGKPKIGGVA